MWNVLCWLAEYRIPHWPLSPTCILTSFPSDYHVVQYCVNRWNTEFRSRPPPPSPQVFNLTTHRVQSWLRRNTGFHTDIQAPPLFSQTFRLCWLVGPRVLHCALSSASILNFFLIWPLCNYTLSSAGIQDSTPRSKPRLFPHKFSTWPQCAVLTGGIQDSTQSSKLSLYPQICWSDRCVVHCCLLEYRIPHWDLSPAPLLTSFQPDQQCAVLTGGIQDSTQEL